MKKSFTDALEFSRQVFYDLNVKRLQFTFRSLPDKKQMRFTAVENADTIKSIFPQFEILLDARRRRFVELIINYE